MKQFIVSFTNGEKIKISQEIADHLYTKMVKDPQGAKQFQFFTDAKTDATLLAINTSEIVFIAPSENIV